MRLPLSSHESLYPLGALLCLDFVFYDVERIRGHASVLDVVCLSTRYPLSFLCSSKRPPLAVLQNLFNVLKQKDWTIRRIRVDEHGSLARSYEFNMLLVKNDMQLETTEGCGSKLNTIVERSNRECHATTRIGIGLQSLLPKSHWCFAIEHVVLIKSHSVF